MSDNVVYMAQIFATAAHQAVNQKRKYTGEDYINHPKEVAGIVASVSGTKEMIAAAWLHDVVEDTGVTTETIRQVFGEEIAELVGWLTDVSTKEDGSRAKRKAIDCQHTAGAPAAAQTVKLADLISNSQSIAQHDPKFAKTYMKEKRNLLNVLTRGDKALWNRANKIVEDWENSQGS